MRDLQWLMDSDPSLRWQVMRDLANASLEDVEKERSRVSEDGHGARLLETQSNDGRWNGAAWNHGWDSTMHVLLLLRDFGIDPKSERVLRAIERVRDCVTWHGCGPAECDDNPFFAGEIEPCINGQVAAVGAYFRQNVDGLITRLLEEQLEDGGWNCEAERGSKRSSFNTTICVLDALLEYERAGTGSIPVQPALRRGEEYLLERRLFKRRSSHHPIPACRKCGASFTQLAFPSWWHYDVLRGVDHFRASGAPPDPRLREAVEMIRDKRGADGHWLLEAQHPGTMPIELGESVGQPSRWNTLRSVRVLAWFDGESRDASSQMNS